MILGLRSWGIGVALGAVALGGCNVEPDQTPSFTQHCAELQGDATCASTYANRPFCSTCTEANQGCVASFPGLACVPDPVDPTTGDPDTGDGDEDSSTGADSTTSGLDSSDGGTSTGEPGCENEGQLDPSCMELDGARPYCSDSLCVSCDVAGGDAFCGELDAAAPGCDAESGSCSPCDVLDHNPCVEANPVCGASGQCEPCTEHAQCSTGACHRAADDPLFGYCFADDEVIYIDASATCPGLGTAEEPACSLLEVSESLSPGINRVLRLAPGTPHLQRGNFAGKSTVAIIGDGGEAVVAGAPGQNSATLRIESEVRAYIANLDLRGNAFSHGVLCNNATVHMETTRIRDNDGWGVFDFDPCTLDFDRVVIANNEDGGIRLDEGSLSLVNSVVGANGIGGASTGVRVENGDVQILYSTIAGNDGAGSDSIECTNATGVLRNSLIVGVDDTSIDLDCFPLIMEHNALDAANFSGGTNVEVPAYSAVQFNGPNEGDFTLAAPPLSPYGDIAQWEEGDPPLDADGTPRPMGEDVLGFAGVDEP